MTFIKIEIYVKIVLMKNDDKNIIVMMNTDKRLLNKWYQLNIKKLLKDNN